VNGAAVALREVGLPVPTDSQLEPPVTVHETGRVVGFAGATDRPTLVVTLNAAVPNDTVWGAIAVMVMVGGLATVRVTVKVAVSGPFTPLTVTMPTIGPAASGEILVGSMLMVSGVIA